MKLSSGVRLGPYEIEDQIGAGGMGEVYRARDTRLDRSVAVKVLGGNLPLTSEVRQRFEREARTISSLSHPNICTLHDVGREGDTDYLVMELLDGQSLQQRLEQGPLPMDEVLRVGIQIADALEKAHASGVIHRDLKPGNIFLTERGVKLLDFGLAKLHTPLTTQSGATVLGQLPTQASGVGPLTTEGTLLGTFQYMSPEQLEGREADTASDIFALGAVLYEMATAKKAFAGKSQASLIGAIMHSAPPAVSTVAPMSTPAFDRVVSTCLAKDPRDRWQTAHDVRLQLSWIAEGGSMVGLPAPVAHHRKNRERLAWALAAVAALAALALAVGFVRRAPGPPRVVRFTIAQPEQLGSVGAPKISPDGTQIAFVAADPQGKNQIWLRPLDALTPRALAGSEGVTNQVRPFWSPDSRFVAFFQNGKLMKQPVDGGPPVKIADSPINGGDGTWNDDGVMLFDGGSNDPIRRVDAGGGVMRVEQPGGDQGVGYQVAWPQFLPDGKHYVFIIFGGKPEQNGVWLGMLGSKERHKVVDGLSRVEFAPPHWLLFVRETTVVAQQFDTANGKLVGEPVPVADGVGVTSVGQADFSASRNGVLVYRAGASDDSRLLWLDLKGEPVAGAPDPGDGLNPALSPDGRWLAVNRSEGKNEDIWLRDLKRGVSSRFTTDPRNEYAPLFTRDGASVLFSRDMGSGWGIVLKSIDTQAERVLVPPANTALAFAIAPDGRTLVYAMRVQTGGNPRFNLMVTDVAAGGVGKPYAASDFGQFGASFSPDGRWLAYQSNQSGRNEVYVQAFPTPGRSWQVSTAGGTAPHWGHDGATIYYTSDNKLMKVEVKTAPAFDAGIPQPLFVQPLAQIVARNKSVYTPDDQQLLVTASAGSNTATPNTVILNWDAALRR